MKWVETRSYIEFVCPNCKEMIEFDDLEEDVTEIMCPNCRVMRKPREKRVIKVFIKGV